ncbi:MAG: hypothetical protein U9O06_00045 [Euryarchaeota archaeon]|nr:hypothetical protein [Euryarchaeota archaeon]
MDLVVTTPGVSTPALRPALESEPREGLLVIDRATRCGTTAVDPTTASRLRLAVAPCAVSLHAADRAQRRVDQSVDGVIVCQSRSDSPSDDRLETRFDCPVSVHTPTGEHSRRPRYSKR